MLLFFRKLIIKFLIMYARLPHACVYMHIYAEISPPAVRKVILCVNMLMIARNTRVVSGLRVQNYSKLLSKQWVKNTLSAYLSTPPISFPLILPLRLSWLLYRHLKTDVQHCFGEEFRLLQDGRQKSIRDTFRW